MGHRLRFGSVTIVLALVGSTAWSSRAAAQPPPGKGTDMEIDPDAPKQPQEQPAEATQPAELPPVDPGAWGVGGKEEEGRFAPGARPAKDAVEEKEETPDALPPPGSVGVDALFGFGSIRDVTNDVNRTDVFVASFIFGAQYRFGETWMVRARFPYSTGSTRGPGDAADDFNSFAVGNLELALMPSFRLTPRLRLPVGLALDLPFASGDLFPADEEQGARAQALVAQSAITARGFEEYALFASKRFGIVPSVGIAYDRAPIHASASTKLELMFKTGGNEPPTPPPGQEAAIVHDPATNWVTALSFGYGFFGGKLMPMLRTWLAVARPPVSVGTSNYAGALWAIEPRVMGRLDLNAKGSVAVQGGIGYVLPVAGELGGDAGASGLRVLASLLF
jgi:hypothetical protein